MILTQYILMAIALVNTAIGIAIYTANPKRTQNILLFHFCNTLTLWMFIVIGIISSTSPKLAEVLIRAASIIATLIPQVLALLLLAIKYPSFKFSHLIAKNKAYLIPAVLVIGICFTQFFLESVHIPTVDENSNAVAEANYGAGFFIYVSYFFITIFCVIWSSVRHLKKCDGIARTELQYVLLGAGLMLLVSFSLSLLIPLILKTTQLQQFGPISVIVMNLIIAYGIATKRILDVGTVIRRIVAYTILSCYLVVFYILILIISKYGIFRLSPNSDLLSQLTAAIATAFSMAPVHGRLQNVTNKLITSHSMNIPNTMKKAGDVFQSITTIDALLGHFSKLLSNSLRADSVRTFLKEGGSFAQYYPDKAITFSKNTTVTGLIKKHKAPVSIDNLMRVRQTKEVKLAQSELIDLQASLAVGIFSKSELRGLILFGSRMGGRIYDKTEQDALQILCNQFAVALENAELYTEMQNSKIRNEIMLDQLVSGVIVADSDLKITLFNHEAQRITGIEEQSAIGQQIDILPRPIYQALETSVKTKSGSRNMDATLFITDEEVDSVSVRMGSEFLFGHDDNPMGALLVFTDMTELKSLEEQVRRTDQLSIVGTLAAGMAHEIKNPLVTIKTFSQLLPQRYADEDFRQNFSTLVTHEVSRIDGIVNELLSFSKPAKPHLVPMNLQETLDQTLKLTHEQMTQKNITLKNRCTAKTDTISGDAKLLSQALVNLYLNAIDAIADGGMITAGTTNCKYRFATGSRPDQSTTKTCIRLQISDTGKGINQDDLKKIFDPFFTNKSDGTGMGLAVAHGIIREHHGVIEVESEEGRGTTFFIYIPLNEGANE